ncbi:MAG: SIMPL domain-containing protein [Candidatus Doudnabacteria bacterium]|nr:SIMPL domain-containing protein [Candidatus Doudnabacteria bacterium]
MNIGSRTHEQGGILDKILTIVAILAIAGVAGALLWGNPIAVHLSGIPQNGNTAEGLQVVGTGTVKAVPETGTITIGVLEEAKTAAEAQQQGARISNAIRAVLEDEGVNDEDIETAGYSVQPDYSYERGDSQIVGYIGRESFQVRIRDLDSAGTILSRATAAGANTVSGLSFELDEEEEERLKDEARLLAIEDAASKADDMADAAEAQLGSVRSIAEVSSRTPEFYDTDSYALTAESDGAELVTPVIEAGEREISVSVTVVYNLR